MPRDKLEPLGVDPDRDKAKLIESKKQTERKAVKKAFEEAILHQCRVAGQSSALSEDSDSSHWTFIFLFYPHKILCLITHLACSIWCEYFKHMCSHWSKLIFLNKNKRLKWKPCCRNLQCEYGNFFPNIIWTGLLSKILPGLAYFRSCFQPVWTSFNRLGLTCKHYQPKCYFLAGRYSPYYRSRNSATHYNNFDFMRGLFYYLLSVCFLLNEITFRSRRSLLLPPELVYDWPTSSCLRMCVLF